LFAAAGRLQAARRRGPPDADAEAWFEGRGVHDPATLARLLAPGI
jgi:hypothetical protein